MPQKPFERIHHINRRFNEIFDRPIYYFAEAVTTMNFVLPYPLRIAFAFAINVFCNRPVVYLNFLSQKIGKKMNFVIISLLYFTLMGIYAVLYRISGLWKTAGGQDSTWVDIAEFQDKTSLENYFYQS